MAITLKANVRWGGVDYAPGATIPGLTPSDEAGLVSSNRAEWAGTPSTTSNAAVPVMATTGPGGGVVLIGPDGQEISGVGSVVQHMLAKADIAARPPRLEPIDSVPVQVYNCDDTYAYGKSSSVQVVRVDLLTRVVESVYTVEVGSFISDIFVGHGVILMTVGDVTNKYTLRRSVDRGVSFTVVHNLGTSFDGVTHSADIKLLMRGLAFGKIAGGNAIVFITYNNANGADGTPESQNYVGVSYDNGATWGRLTTWNLVTKKTKHGHAVEWDKHREKFWFSTGDNGSEIMACMWDGVSPWPQDMSPVDIINQPGFSGVAGKQRNRTVGLLPAADRIYTTTDTTSATEGGIWAFNPDGSGLRRVNNSIHGKDHDGWCFLECADGTMLMMDDAKADTVGVNRHIAIYGSANGDRWYDIARVALTGTGVALPRGLFQDRHGAIWVSTDSVAGKGFFDSSVLKLTGKFIDGIPDNVLPAYFVDPINGDDTNDGFGVATAWKTLGCALTGSKVTHGARVVVAAGDMTEAATTTLAWGANGRAAIDVTARVQITGAGKKATVITISTGNGIYDAAGTFGPYVEYEKLTLRQGAIARSLYWDASGAAVAPKWLLRDAQIGDSTIGSTYALWLRSAGSEIKGTRIDVRNSLTESGKYTIRIDSGTLDLTSSTLIGGRGYMDGSAQVSIKHCHFDDTAMNAFEIASSATVKPVIKNNTFGPNGTLCRLHNASALVLTTNDVDGNVFSSVAGSGLPSGMQFPEAFALDHDPATLVPYSGAEMSGVCQPVGVYWDYYGRPFRARPTAGCAEIIG